VESPPRKSTGNPVGFSVPKGALRNLENTLPPPTTIIAKRNNKFSKQIHPKPIICEKLDFLI
jgi:hypothetical protein